MHFTIESARELSARRSARVPHWDMLKITRFLLWFGPNFALLGCMGEHRKHPVEPLIISPDYVSHIVTFLKRCACDFCADFIEIFAWNMIFIAGFDLKNSNVLLFFNDFCVFSFEFSASRERSRRISQDSFFVSQIWCFDRKKREKQQGVLDMWGGIRKN